MIKMKQFSTILNLMYTKLPVHLLQNQLPNRPDSVRCPLSLESTIVGVRLRIKVGPIWHISHCSALVVNQHQGYNVPREVAVFSKEDNLVTSFTNPGFLFPCSIAFCPEKREAFILDKRWQKTTA